MNNSFTHLDLDKYFKYVELVGSLSRLCSDNERPYIDYRTAEHFFCSCVHPEFNPVDLTRDDTSFDASIVTNGRRVGVGIKTFVGQMVKGRYKDEKVAEFAKKSQTGNFNSLSDEDVAHVVSEWRNEAIRVDAANYNVDIAESFYHCLIRVPGAVFFHEEPYPVIQMTGIIPTDRNGRPTNGFEKKKQGTVYFSDGVHSYRYSRSKNVLYKRFHETSFSNTGEHPILIAEDPVKLLEEMMGRGRPSLLLPVNPRQSDKRPIVILELSVQPKSGLNQWNAAGRKRKFAEAYIPVPSWINDQYPTFFPRSINEKGKPEGEKFNLKLPDDSVISAKLCQANLKALMSDPNEALLHWLYRILDGSFEQAEAKRFHPETGGNVPYTKEDLERIGRDSVAVIKNSDESFELELLPIGAFEVFRERFKESRETPTVMDLENIFDALRQRH